MAAARQEESAALDQLRGAMHREAAADIAYPPSGETIVARGTCVSSGHLDLLARVARDWRNAIAENAANQLELMRGASPADTAPLQAGDAATGAARRRELEQVRTDLAGLRKADLLDERRYHQRVRHFGQVFRAGMGTEAVLELLADIDLDGLSRSLRASLTTAVGPARAKSVRRLSIVEAFRASGVPPQSMVLTVIPVLPPDLRPVVLLDGGRMAASDLNDLYLHVINRNNRVKQLRERGAPEIMLRNEKRLLQEAVDALIDNGRRGRRAALGAGYRKLKSLADLLKGKQGRFRENLLGKRVDYSGRSVIVVGPDLKLDQCGLPKAMALELFKPFVMRRLVEQNFAARAKSARRFVEQRLPQVWDVLAEVVAEHPVLLNRPPSLHRMNLLAFSVVLVEGDAIQIPPLVCSGFNADFDGDQMAVHVPLSPASVGEAEQILLASRNVLSPATGEPTVGATQDMVLGCFSLTQERPGKKGEGRVFSDTTEALLAYEHGVVDLQAPVGVRLPDADVYVEAPPSQPAARRAGKPVVTTVGRLIFNDVLPERLRYRNYVMKKEHLRRCAPPSRGT